MMRLKQGYIDDFGNGHIPLTRGHETLVSAHKFHLLSQFNWFANRNPDSGRWDARRNVRLPNGKQKVQLMARFIMGVTDSAIEVDHANRNTLDNRTENLRIATHRQNVCNVGLRATSTSGRIGVTRHQGGWVARISVNSKRLHIGCFATREAAALAYNEAALKYHGEFAVLNPLPLEQLEQAA